MKKILGLALWLTFPGVMHLTRDKKSNKPIETTTYRRVYSTTLVLSIVGALVYGAIAAYFGTEPFRNTWKEILSPLAALVWLPNVLFATLSVLALIVRKNNTHA